MVQRQLDVFTHVSYQLRAFSPRAIGYNTMQNHSNIVFHFSGIPDPNIIHGELTVELLSSFRLDLLDGGALYNKLILTNRIFRKINKDSTKFATIDEVECWTGISASWRW
ncbi:9948_t:CDS:2 [Entrophospora sp. SA101]|nr:9948_t:CDS:2 [Entrophospora sp. SA101]